MRRACIDIGSTTTRLLVAEDTDGLRVVATSRAFTPARPEALAEVVAEQQERARRNGAEARVVGTAHLRRHPELLAALPREVEVLSGEEEGRLAFLGATWRLTGECAVVDVGGGSTEVIVGPAGGTPAYVRSFPAGSGVLVTRCGTLDPPTPACLERLAEAAAQALDGCDAPPAGRALAVGGSATALAAVGDDLLDEDGLQRALEALCGAPAELMARRTGLHPRRVRLLPGGLSLLLAAARTLGRPLELAEGGLREGIVLEALSHDDHMGGRASGHPGDQA